MTTNKIKFIVDVGVGKKVEEFLKTSFDVVGVREIDPKLTDREILQIAVDEGRFIITMDKDFGDLVYNSGLEHSGVLLLRLEDANGDEKVRVISIILEKYVDRIINGFCVFQNGRVRIKHRNNTKLTTIE